MTKQQLRRQRKKNELETSEPKCQLCGQEDIFSMATEKVKATKSILEKHHLLGKHEGEEIIVCLNCHAKLTDDQLDWPEGLLDENRSPEMMSVAFFFGLSAVLLLIAAWCLKHATILYDFVRRVQK
jgi:hypothetical protein